MNSPAAINIVAKTNKSLLTKLNALTMDMFTQAVGDTLTPAQIQNWKAMMAGKADNMGQEAAISFSFAPAMLPVAIKGVIQVPDPKAALDQVNTELQLANEMYKTMGLDATLAIEPERQLYKGVQIHALRFNMKAPPEASEEEKVTMESMFGSAGSAFNIKFAAAGSFMLVGVGPDADKDLRGLIDRALSGRFASPTGDIKAAMAAIPDVSSTDFVASVNVIRLLSGVGAMMSVMPIPGGEMIGLMFSDLDMPTESCIALAGKMDGGAATLQIALPKQHLIEIAAIAAKLQGAVGAAGAGPGMSMGPGEGEDMEGFTMDFGNMDNPEDTVTIKIMGVTDDATKDAIKGKLKTMTDGGHSMKTMKMDGVVTVELSPVRDVEAFARKIDFGTVTEVKNRTVTVQVNK